MSPREYASRSDSDFFYVAEENKIVRAFLMCYDDKNLERMVTDSMMGHEDNLVRFVLQQGRPFIFGDQIGVQPEFQNHGIGNYMLDRLFSDMKSCEIHDIYVGVLKSPATNTESIDFVTDYGFDEVSQIMNDDKHLWSVYKKN
ncbi:MAG: GNAT family N-acetyltransferase [Candidatus Aenigmarchaeota archaeon]|nr:GNAT family N-acetyltransferase [Candidatus Aenigmarchaeota archaeon]MDI6722703.1 GNAT family N-acetyltransferase [Candidatus Aenigmarchaeota archaeon]